MTQVLTADRLKQLLHYDPETGVWTWLKARGRNAPAGARAGRVQETGYRHIKIDGKIYKSGRLAHFYMTGKWPENLVDHEDTDKSNDRWTNLRDATRSQNQGNRPLNRNNKSGLKGVSWAARQKKWKADIRFGGRSRHLGYFISKEVAHEAYVTAARQYFGEFARAA